VEHFYVKFSDPSCIGFKTSCKNKQQDTQTNKGKNPMSVTAVRIGNNR